MQKRHTGPRGKNGRGVKKARGAGTRDPERTSAVDPCRRHRRSSPTKGYSGARIDAIAARAGANKRMIYHYFGDKEALYLAVLEGGYAGIRSAEAGCTSPISTRGGDRAAHRLHLGLFSRAPGIPEPAQHREPASRQVSQALGAGVQPALAAGGGDLATSSSAAWRSGEFRNGVDPVQLYISIASLGFFYLSNRWTLSTIFRRDLAEPAELEARGEHIKEVILGYLRP